MQTAKVGKDVDSWCTRCKLMLAHTVEAMVSGKITRVHCKTCRTPHAYRPQPPGVRAVRISARAGGRTAKAAAAVPQAADYARLMQGRDTAKARPYTVQGRFAPKELIAHSTFGLGLVMAVRGGDKIDVLFPDSLKVLVNGR